MTLDKATTDLSIQLEVKRKLGKNRQADAIQLGIEALKEIKYLHEIQILSDSDLLPGETKE